MTGALLSSGPQAPALPAASGLPLAAYRTDHVHRCVLRFAQREGIRDLSALAILLESDIGARSRFRRAVTGANSTLFRDAEQLRRIDRSVLPGLTAGAPHLRVWSAGCASGEEAFTLAMMLEWHNALGRSEIVASDILAECLLEAETGVCGGSRIPATLRSRVSWDERDLTSGGAPAGDPFDLIVCRNVCTWMTDEATAAVHTTLARGLKPGGVLVLGRDERLAIEPQLLGLQPIADDSFRRCA